jgi:5-methyltetrahydrofolate--homocysteine methyltransferase
MPLIVNELHRRGLNYPVLIGGAAINRRFGWRILYTEDGTPHAPGVFYCQDAFEGLETMEKLIDAPKRELMMEDIFSKAAKEMDRELKPRPVARVGGHSAVKPAENIPLPEKWGVRVVKDMPLELVFECLYKNELFRLSWGAKNKQGEDWKKIKKDFEARLVQMKKDAQRTGWLKPQGVYGFWPAQAEGDSLIVYDPNTVGNGKPTKITQFDFPRQPSGELLCLADYFASVESGKMDVVALQIVTVGQAASEKFDDLQNAGDYTEAYFTHGLAVQTAEATAEYLHRHIRRELGIPAKQGKRYSWGYPAIPDLDDHAKVFKLLPAEKELGMQLTEAYQIIPEQSTAAIILHHPQAKYYSVGESRVEQLMKAQEK